MDDSEALKLIKIEYKNRNYKEIELNINNKLNIIRNELTKLICFPFVFLDEDNNEISEKDELLLNLNDILDGKLLYIKKKLKSRIILGEKIETKNNLDYYLYPKFNLSENDKKNSTNIMVLGETGVGKSTWINSFLNHLEEVDIDENFRYILFDEKKLQLEYESKYDKKTLGSSVTDKSEIYDIPSNKLFNNNIRLIDTIGFGDTRGIEFDNKIAKDIKNLLDNYQIDNLKAICLIFKGSDTRAHDRLKYIYEKLFSLFSYDTKKNFIIIINFIDSIEYIPAIEILKNESLPFIKIFDNIDTLPKFYFNNNAYNTSDKLNYENIYENNKKNFNNFLKCLSNLNSISLNNTKKVINSRTYIIEQFEEINKRIEELNKTIDLMKSMKMNLIDYDKDKNYNNYKHKYTFCKNCEKICFVKFTIFFDHCLSCTYYSCDITNHKFIVYHNEKESKNNRHYYNYNSTNNEYNDKIFIESYHKIYHFLKNCFETLKRINMENEEINKIILQKENENNNIYTILNENLKNNDKLTYFIKDIFRKCNLYNSNNLQYNIDKFINSLSSKDYK